MENQQTFVVNNNPFRLLDEQSHLIQFGQIEHGLLAGVYKLVEDIRSHRRACRVADIIGRWPLQSSLPTDFLVSQVCHYGYLQPNDQIDLKNRNRLSRLAWGLSCVLCGVQLPFNRVEYAVTVALRK